MSATASLAKSAGALKNPFDGALAQYQDQLVAPATQDFSEGSGVNFLGFADAKSKNLADLLAAGIQPGQAYVRAFGKYIKLERLEFHLIAASQLWCEFDNLGNVNG